MSTEAPDPRSFKSWEDAFQYPIPAVRGMEKKLRSSIEENHEKLRALVGASYRDLLGTARTIIDVHAQMQEIEGLLQQAGQKSDSRIFDKIGGNYAALESSSKPAVESHLAFASQFSVLQSCLNVVARLLKHDVSVLLSAKLLVVARLLHKTLSEEPDQPPLLRRHGDRLGFLRQKLLRHIDRRLSRPNVETPTLVEDMTAFALATSSSPTDVLRHFQHLRLDAIGRALGRGKESVRGSILRRIQLFLGTLKDSRTCFPELFASSAKALGARALLDDEAVRLTDELDLDIHARWFAPEVQNFTPWTRHDELQRQKVDELQQAWTDAALKILPERVSDDVQDETDIKLLAAIRRDILQMWLSSKPNSIDVKSRQVLEQLRRPFLQRLDVLIKVAFGELKDSICQSVQQTLDEWDISSTKPDDNGLWDSNLLSMETRDGAHSFRTAVIDRRLGKDEKIHDALAVYETHAKSIQAIREIIREMQSIKWDYDFEADDENDTESETIQDLLSHQDSDEVQKNLKRAALESFSSTEEFLVHRIQDQPPDCGHASSPGIFLLRFVRELRHRVPSILREIDAASAPRPQFAQAGMLMLHRSLAVAAFEKIVPVFSTSMAAFVESRRPVRSLWAGTPSLPVLPLPATFKFLRAAVKEMEHLGPDLWSPDAVALLKALLQGKLAEVVRDGFERLYNVHQPALADATVSKDADFEAVAVAKSEADGIEESADTENDKREPAETAEDAEAHAAAAPEADEAADAAPSNEQNGAPPEQEAPEPQADPLNAEDKSVQLVFDALYLNQALSTQPSSATNGSAGTSEDAFSNVIESLKEKASLDEAAIGRLRKNSTDYWKRSYLLFGLLAA